MFYLCYLNYFINYKFSLPNQVSFILMIIFQSIRILIFGRWWNYNYDLSLSNINYFNEKIWKLNVYLKDGVIEYQIENISFLFFSYLLNYYIQILILLFTLWWYKTLILLNIHWSCSFKALILAK